MSVPTASPNVYVVDDERVIAFSLAAILNQKGYAAVAFTNPLEALEAARTNRPHLLISDVMMPQITGVELAMQIRKACPECRILLFSGQAATADLLAEARNHGHDFTLLAKPIHPNDLLRRIQALVEEPPYEVAAAGAARS